MASMITAGWLQNCAHYCPTYKNKPFFQLNPLVGQHDDRRPFIISALNMQNYDGDNIYDIAQLFLFFATNDGSTYQQIIHPNMKSDGKYVSCAVPIWSGPDSIEDQMLNIYKQEIYIAKHLNNTNRNAPESAFLKTYYNHDYFTEEKIAGGECLVSHLLTKHGHIIEEFVESVIDDIDIVPQLSDLYEEDLSAALYSAAYNLYINNYWLTHILFGYHAQYDCAERLSAVARSSIHTGPTLMRVDGVPERPTLHYIVINPIDGINKSLSFCNTYFREMISSGTACVHQPRQKFFVRMQHVDEHGEAFCLSSYCMQVHESSFEKFPQLKAVDQLIQKVEEECRSAGQVCPLVLVAVKSALLHPQNVPVIDVGNTNEEGCHINVMPLLNITAWDREYCSK